MVKKLSEEYGKEYDVDVVKKTLESEYRKKTKIKTKYSNMADMVYDVKWAHRRFLRLHPLGLEKFKEILDKGK